MPIVTSRTSAMVAPASLLPTDTTRPALALLSTPGGSLASTRGTDSAAVLHVAVGALLAARTETGHQAVGRAAGNHFAPAVCASAGKTRLLGHALAIALRIRISI